MNMTLGGIVFRALIIACIGMVGVFMNARWKVLHEGIKGLGNWFQFMLLGLLGWIGLCMWMFGGFSGAALGCIAGALALAAITFLLSLRYQMPALYRVRLLLMALLAGMGKWMSLVLKITLVGIPVARAVETAGYEGTNAVIEMMLDAADEREASSASVEPADYIPVAEPEAVEKKNVQVWRENGMMKDYYKVSSDGERYYDPEDGQWHKIPD